MTKDAKFGFRKGGHRYESDSTTNTLFKRETKDGESKALIIYIIIKMNDMICLIILSQSNVSP